MLFRDPEDWTDEEIERHRDLLRALVYQPGRRPYIPRTEWEQLGWWRRWRDRFLTREPVEQRYDRAVRAQRARRAAAAERERALRLGGDG
jgi:hypothetical protein